MPAPTDPHSHDPDTPAPGTLRAGVERLSLPILTQMTRLPVWLPFAAVLVLILGGAWLGGIAGSIAVGVAVLAVIWLLYLAWPRLTGVERLMRIAVLALVLAIAVSRLVPT